MDKAQHHLKLSLLASPTAEAWSNAGNCAYQRALVVQRQQGDPEQAQALFREALRYLAEANVRNRRRPQIGARLTMCAVELGRVQVAKQCLRQVLRHRAQLDVTTALDLARVLLRFSDERGVPREARPRLVQDGRYAREAIMVLQDVLAKQDGAEARFLLAQGFALAEQDAAAAEAFASALQWFDGEALKKVLDEAKACAARLLCEAQHMQLLEEAINAAEGSLGLGAGQNSSLENPSADLGGTRGRTLS